MGKEDALILALLYEVHRIGLEPETQKWPDARKIAGFRSNHSPDLIRRAAAGDVQALVELRRDNGLPVFV